MDRRARPIGGGIAGEPGRPHQGAGVPRRRWRRRARPDPAHQADGSGAEKGRLYYSTEGHGFYTDPHRREYYGKLLAFLSNSLGGETASASTPAQP